MNSISNDIKPKQETTRLGSEKKAESAPKKPGEGSSNTNKTGKAGESGKSEELSPDEIASRILGIVDEHQDDENFDLEASKFWYQAAYKEQLEGLFQEKNRMRILVNQLKKRGYTEAEIYELFARVRKAQLSSEKAMEEAEKKSELLKKKLMNIGLFLVTIFIIGQMFFKSNEYALERENQRIAEVKTLLCEIDKPPLQTKTNFDAQWNEVVGLTTGLQEGMFVKTTTGAHKINLAENATIIFDADAVFKVEKVTLDSELQRVAEVSLTITQGIMSWNFAEDSGIKLNLTFSRNSLDISYGMGKVDLTCNPDRVAIKEGETSIKVGRSLSRALNGLMEAVLSDPPEFKIYDSY